jgi:hypothetical protein
MMVPLLCNVELPERPMRTVDVFPAYLKLLGRSVPENIDGRCMI